MPRVLALMAHPDDIEITCAGTLILLRAAGWDVHMATMTAGDLGSATLPAAAISRIRRKEAAASARLLGAGYTCLGIPDLTIAHGERQKRIVTGLLRAVRPDLLITHPPVDYMADHEQTSYLARDAAFGSTIRNWAARRPVGVRAGKVAPPCDTLPALLFADPIDLATPDGSRARARQVVDISSVIEQKAAMLAAHASQRAWLQQQHGEDEYLHWMRRVGVERARAFGRKTVTHAEGFVPYHGHAFPHDDLLTQALGRRLVKTLARKADSS
jgi:LmbE family N-acetylglucosaminyl deacetylase